MINNRIKAKKRITEPFNLSKMLVTIKVIKAANELTDTIRVNVKTTNQAPSTIKKRSG